MAQRRWIQIEWKRRPARGGAARGSENDSARQHDSREMAASGGADRRARGARPPAGSHWRTCVRSLNGVSTASPSSASPRTSRRSICRCGSSDALKQRRFAQIVSRQTSRSIESAITAARFPYQTRNAELPVFEAGGYRYIKLVFQYSAASRRSPVTSRAVSAGEAVAVGDAYLRSKAHLRSIGRP